MIEDLLGRGSSSLLLLCHLSCSGVTSVVWLITCCNILEKKTVAVSQDFGQSHFRTAPYIFYFLNVK